MTKEAHHRSLMFESTLTPPISHWKQTLPQIIVFTEFFKKAYANVLKLSLQSRSTFSWQLGFFNKKNGDILVWA
jgi:hypothetical protein